MHRNIRTRKTRTRKTDEHPKPRTLQTDERPKTDERAKPSRDRKEVPMGLLAHQKP